VQVEACLRLRILHRRVDRQQEVEMRQQVEEEPAAQQQEAGQHHIGDRRDEVGAQLLAGDGEGVPHAVASSCTGRTSAESLVMYRRNTCSSPMLCVKFASVSSTAMRPSLMITTFSHSCETSGRMCVDRMTVRSPARSLIKVRMSMICRGSRPM